MLNGGRDCCVVEWHNCFRIVSVCLYICVQSSEVHRQTDSPSFLQQSSSSPFRYSPSNPPSSGQSFYPRLSSSSHPGLSQDHPSSSSYASQTTPTSSSDSRPPGGSLHQQSSSSNSMDGAHGYSGSHLKASLLNSSGSVGSPTSVARAHSQAKTDSGTQASRLSQQQASRSLKTGSSGQAVLQAGSRLLSNSGAPHYPQRGAPLSQFQHPPIQGSGVRTQSGSF